MMDFARLLAVSVPLLISVIAVIVSLRALRTTQRLNRAKFLYDLHQDFFVKPTYSAMRDALDGEPGNAALAGAIEQQSDALIQFLNFFELVAYFEESRQLTSGDVEALLGYYLDCFRHHFALCAYISKEGNSFGKLNQMLERRTRERGGWPTIFSSTVHFIPRRLRPRSSGK